MKRMVRDLISIQNHMFPILAIAQNSNKFQLKGYLEAVRSDVRVIPWFL